ncbi:TetR/AcrR family transcriptional regulator [Actinoplanes sp. NPDC051343]|uniref:TetR/AcrR family transcriptional regulator n=1 Tax=Actinoplanes sp. NPDC051343 TaxID=3363906 RepID=UPI00378C3539
MSKVSDEHKAARRRQILDAAARCFARDGFHRTSMQDIVRESGISAGLVYRYFEGKDDMIAAIVAEWHEQRQIVLTEAAYLDLLRAVGDPDARERMRLGVQIWAEAIRSPRVAEVARRTIDEPRAAVAGLFADNGDGFARVLIALYQGLQLQTAWDETVDNEAYVVAVQALLRRMDITSGDGQPSTR